MENHRPPSQITPPCEPTQAVVRATCFASHRRCSSPMTDPRRIGSRRARISCRSRDPHPSAAHPPHPRLITTPVGFTTPLESWVCAIC
ncbi:hypothetical protein TIFTF001_052719 [Ficus carica]|uniref:Uncharacterized protein n=1 Tax=Ficus carica TaxID=3494 RepID=A0AA88EKX3_FICCA|nr:hypothetical protein TIFTF001_052719 [Ficus carica]